MLLSEAAKQNRVHRIPQASSPRLAPSGLAGDDAFVFLGEDLFAWLTLALGAAMVAGNGLALVRPPEAKRNDDDLERAPIGRAIVYMVIGAVAAIWGLATLIS